MPITIATKFDLGAVVWEASTEGVTKRHPCPDCLGERRWQAISPAGRGYTFECPRCSRNHVSDRALDLSFFEYEPRARRLTLVEFSGVDERGGRWFAAETSAGSLGRRSGTVHAEDTLFATEFEALTVAQQKAFEATDHNRANPQVAETRALRLQVCDYQIDQAKSSADERRLWSYQHKVDDCLTDIEGIAAGSDFTPERVLQTIHFYFPHREG